MTGTLVAFFVSRQQLELGVLLDGPCGDSLGPSRCWGHHLHASRWWISFLLIAELSAWGQKHVAEMGKWEGVVMGTALRGM